MLCKLLFLGSFQVLELGRPYAKEVPQISRFHRIPAILFPVKYPCVWYAVGFL